MPREVVIDAHCHAGHGDGLSHPSDTHASLARYLPRARAAGIDKTVLLAAFHSDYAVANAEVASIVASDPSRFYAFAFVHPDRDRGRVASLVRGFSGIKAHGYDGKLTREVCEVARAYRMPVLYDVFGDAGIAELLASEYPDVAFVFPHLGSYAGDWKTHRALIDILVRHPNAHTDTSGVRDFDLLVECVQRAGAHKVLFGSDGPQNHPGVELAKVELLRLPPRSRALVLGGNYLRLAGR